MEFMEVSAPWRPLRALRALSRLLGAAVLIGTLAAFSYKPTEPDSSKNRGPAGMAKPETGIYLRKPKKHRRAARRWHRLPVCLDGIDNDGDGLYDYPDDPDCRSRWGRSESWRLPPDPQPTPQPDPNPIGNPPEQGNPTTVGNDCNPSSISVGAGVNMGRCRPFPADNPWNQDISQMPVDPNSSRLLSSIGLDIGLHPDFGTVWDGKPIGIPFAVVGGDQPRVPVSFDVPDESDSGPYPVPDWAPIEGGSNSDGDRHVLVVDRDSWKLYELYYAFKSGSDWRASSGAVFDLSTNYFRPQGWTSADAAGLPIFPALVRYEEVYDQGEIRHALRFTAPMTRRGYVWPASHWASWFDDADLPPMGMRVRLRASYDISPFPYPVQIVLQALKRYGMILADNGAPWFITGVPDSRWNDSELHYIGEVKGRDFEVVEMGRVVTP